MKLFQNPVFNKNSREVNQAWRQTTVAHALGRPRFKHDAPIAVASKSTKNRFQKLTWNPVTVMQNRTRTNALFQLS